MAGIHLRVAHTSFAVFVSQMVARSFSSVAGPFCPLAGVRVYGHHRLVVQGDGVSGPGAEEVGLAAAQERIWKRKETKYGRATGPNTKVAENSVKSGKLQMGLKCRNPGKRQSLFYVGSFWAAHSSPLSCTHPAPSTFYFRT